MKSTRRNVLQGAGLMGIWPFSKLSFAGKMPASIYQQLGIRPVINCRGTHTVIGASKAWPELQDAMVTTGCAGAITLGTCAAVTGMDSAKVRQLPNLTGVKSEALIQKIHRNG